jgi:hypothetical protein
VKAHLKDIHTVLSTISAIAGLVALVTPPPVDVIALGVSVAAGAGALATDLADPQFRHGIGELLHGHVNKESLGTLATGVGDVLSVVPGLTVAGKAGWAALKGGTVAAEAGSAGANTIKGIATAVAHQPGWGVKQLAKLPGALKLGEAATFADKLLKPGEEGIKAIDRLNFLWKVKGVGSHLYNDVKQAAS